VTGQPDRASHWVRWHADYADPQSRLARRLAVVQARSRQAVEAVPSGPVRLISACAGQGADVVGALAGHVRSTEVTGLLVELDPHNVSIARSALAAGGLTGIEVVQGDASTTDAYEGAAPADVLLLCGIFGNVSDEDVRNTVNNCSRLCAPHAHVIWTRHRRPPDLTTKIRRWFHESGFDEVAFDSPEDQMFAVGVHRLVAAPLPFEPGLPLFTFKER
jgi:hypothetical protein